MNTDAKDLPALSAVSAVSTSLRATTSSASSTPDAQRRTRTMDLTPRSKVKAMLAAFDEDDSEPDKEHVDAGGANARRPVQSVSRSGTEIGERAGPLRNSDMDKEDDSKINRTGVVAKIHTIDTYAKNVEMEDSDSATDGNAYERVKRLLMAVKHSSPAGDEAVQAVIQLTERAQSDRNSDEARARSRHFKRQPGASSTLARSSPFKGAGSPPPRSSPGLFVTSDAASVTRHLDSTTSDAESDAPSLPKLGDRLKDLVVRKRQERLAKEVARGQSSADEASPPSNMHRGKKARHDALAVVSETDDEDEAGKKLTQQARPIRNASKKALEEMHRETQRISRNMQLAHEAKTRVKFTTDSLFTKFNFRQAKPDQAANSSSAAPSSDVELGLDKDTPPSSSPSVADEPHKEVGSITPLAIQIKSARAESDKEDLPDGSTVLTQEARLARQAQARLEEERKSTQAGPEKLSERFSVRKSAKLIKKQQPAEQFDDDLEILPSAKQSRFAAFDQVPASKKRDSHSLHTLRTLAQLNGDAAPRKKGRKSMSVIELQVSLQRRAREQAQRERDEKIQKLKEKGIVVMSAEEKEKDQMQLENMLEKARREADELGKREKEVARKEGKSADLDGQLPDSDDEDDDWDGSEVAEDLELSGSEDEEMEVGKESRLDSEDEEKEEDQLEKFKEHDADEQGEDVVNPFIETEASDDGEVEEDEHGSERAESEAEVVAMVPLPRRMMRKKVVVSDDEDEDSDARPVSVPQTGSVSAYKASTAEHFGFAKAQPSIPGLSQVFGGTMADLTTPDAFGFGQARPALPGLSQLFGGTMADGTQISGDTEAIDSQQDSIGFLRGLSITALPDFGASFGAESQHSRISDSQTYPSQAQDSQNAGMVHFGTQTQVPFEETQASEMPDATQDFSFQPMSSPPKEAPDASYSTVDTVMLAETVLEDSPDAKRKGRLIRRSEVVRATQDGDEDELPEVVTAMPDAFDVLRKAARKPLVDDTFDKNKSEAKAMVEEQAEESEDEYAGLGGASDDESQDEVDEEMRKMIDDDSNERVNEADIAAFYADKERIDDEKKVEQLYKDIANGGLRRKRGADLDLFDSDDEDEAAARRRAAKQREFARMRKALLADEKLGKIAENPKQQAFLQAVEDQDDDDDLNILDEPEDFVPYPADSQSGQESQQQSQQMQEPLTANAAKRAYSQSTGASQPSARLPPNLRRTNKSAKPTSLADIRNTLSEIIGQPDAIAETYGLSFSPEHSADETEDHDDVDRYEDPDEDNIQARKNSTIKPQHHRRTPVHPSHTTVIDRIALKRSVSSLISNTSHTTFAFQTPTTSAANPIRKPSLLRRATTAASNSSSVSTDSGLPAKETVKMGGSKKSSVNYYVREKERMAKAEAVELERKEGRERVGRMRRTGAGLGALIGGNFY